MQPRFLNQVLEVEWAGSPHQLLRAAKGVEREGGRTATRRWGPRIIDAHVRETMAQILEDIRSGAFAEEWIADHVDKEGLRSK